jgi:subtilisin family serine protease
MRKSIIRFIGFLIVALIFSGSVPFSPQIPSAQGGILKSPGAWKISHDLHYAILTSVPDEKISVIISLTHKPHITTYTSLEHNERVQRVVNTLKAHAEDSQKEVRQLLEIWERQGKVKDIEPFWIFNGIAMTASQEVIEWLSLHSDIASITPNRTFEAPLLPEGIQQIEQNLQAINTYALWDKGYRGEGIVVANLDTGVDINHPDLENSWRGGDNSWFDPYGEHPDIPADNNGHGTWTMGVMVGGNGGGSYLGIAPDAKWIAAKIFNDSGVATSSAIHQSYQWIMDPDGEPTTSDAPHVVNNSWGFLSPGCYLDFQQDIQALRAAGILPIFAAGNSGPNGNTSVSPANYPESFSVGAVNNLGDINVGSSRGPSACSGNLFPHVVAPGVGIKSTGLLGGYTTATGTSMASPHTAGSLALLLHAFPSLNVDQQASALINSAVDLGEPGPDNNYGHGQIDVLAAFEWLVDYLGEPENPGNPGEGPLVTTSYLFLPTLLNAP